MKTITEKIANQILENFSSFKIDIYTYQDSVNGTQSDKFICLSNLISYLKNINSVDSEGVIYKNGKEILTYEKEDNFLTFYGPFGWRIG